MSPRLSAVARKRRWKLDEGRHANKCVMVRCEQSDVMVRGILLRQNAPHHDTSLASHELDIFVPIHCMMASLSHVH